MLNQFAIRILAVLSAAIISLTGMVNARQSYTTPDFAYPKTVSAKSVAELDSALKSGDEIKALRQLMDYSLAQSKIGNDNLHDVITKINSVRPLLSQESSQALLSLLKAKIYLDIYTANEYKYDKRNLPLLPLPNNYEEWSGEQFRQVISDLCDDALTAQAQLKTEKLSDYELIIDIKNKDLVYFPTLFDFVAYRTIDFRRHLSEFSNCFSLLLLTERSVFLAKPIFAPSSLQAEKILTTYADLLKFHADNTASLIFADIQRLNFTRKGIYNTMSESSIATYNSLLEDLFHRYSSTQYAGLILENIDFDNYNPDKKKEYYDSVTDFCKRFPAYERIGCLKNKLNIMAQKSVEVQALPFTIPGKEFTITVDVANINEVTLHIYAVNADKFKNETNPKKVKQRLVSEKKLQFTGSTPFYTTEKINITLPEPGKYIVTASGSGITSDENTYAATILCTNIALGISTSTDTKEVIVSESSTGQPIEDALIVCQPKWNNPIFENLGATDRHGTYRLAKSKSGKIIAEKATMGYTQPIDIYGTYPSNTSTENIYGRIFTSLALYRPGDTVEFNAVLYSSNYSGTKILKNKAVKAILKNANRINIDTLELTTDEWGRCYGDFQIPTDELTGIYYIRLSDTERNNRFISEQNFQVSEYKLPTYFVEVKSVLRSIPENGDVIISGRVQTYSGVGLPCVPLKIVLSAEQWSWWRSSNAVQFYSATDTTDTRGDFTIVLPKRLLDNSPAPNGFFTLNIDATSASGESQQTKTSFFRGEAYAITANIPENIDISNPLKLDVNVMRSDATSIDSIIDYTLRNASNEIVLSSSFPSTNPTVNWKRVKSGEYTLTMRIHGNLTDSTTYKNIVLYRPKDKKSPVEQSLWMPYKPEQSVTLDSDRHTELTYATVKPETYILYTLSDADSIIHREWIKAKAGMHKLNVSVPEKCTKPNVILYTLTDFTPITYSFDLDYGKSPIVKIIAESFRDRTIPGSNETWTFRTINQDSAAVASAMILDMYNGALDALCTADWNFDIIRFSKPSTSVYSAGLWDYNSSLFSWSEDLKNSLCSSIMQPAFKLYDTNTFFNSHNLRYNLMMKSTMVGSAAMQESVSIDDAVISEESTVEEELISDSESAITPKEKSEPEFEYRNSETTLAFFAPTLNTDSEGRLSFCFRIPNANTTWRFRALAYTDKLLTDIFSANVIANKPVMVQPNLPRFVRTGDKIDIEALVINNSDSTQNITTVVEFFEPASQTIISSFKSENKVDKGMTATVSTEFCTPSDYPFIGYRVKSSTEQFADGEQSLIPILSTATQVIETHPFYISPDSLQFSIKLPEVSDSARTTLQYCDNPIWTVVTALPGLRSRELSSPSDAADAIFSAAVAEGLLHNYPSIADAFRTWSESNQSDSTLTSMLEKNSDLKTMLLSATPWMIDAMTDTERMQRLTLLFDKKEIANVYSRATSLLEKLQRNNGGWAWRSQYNDVSMWATESTLAILGYLNMLGYMPDNKELSSMITQALSWYQTETVAMHRKYPSMSCYNFLAILDFWPNFKPSASGKAIIASEVQKLVKSWKKLSVGNKAEAARLLYNNGYKTLSRSVLASLREYAVTSPEKGMWWPSLGDSYGGDILQIGIAANALLSFHQIEPNSADIDDIRQWLILQKEAQNWGSSTMTSQIIAAVIMTSPKWLGKASTVNVTIGGEPLEVEYIDSLLGNFRTNISDMKPSGATLTITKSQGTPAWGAIYSNSTETMRSIEASSCEALSIEKKFYKATGEKWSVADSLAVGDKVKIQLLIHTTRDMQYMAISDERAACFDPVEQMPEPIYSEGLCFYRENRDSETNLFVTNMPKGTYLLEYEMWVNNSGEFSSGIATVQSQYAPQLSAHSAGHTISVSAE